MLEYRNGACRAGFALRSLRAGFALRSLRAGFALRPLRACIALRPLQRPIIYPDAVYAVPDIYIVRLCRAYAVCVAGIGQRYGGLESRLSGKIAQHGKA